MSRIIRSDCRAKPAPRRNRFDVDPPSANHAYHTCRAAKSPRRFLVSIVNRRTVRRNLDSPTAGVYLSSTRARGGLDRLALCAVNLSNSEVFLERVIGFEPTTLCLASTRSTN